MFHNKDSSEWVKLIKEEEQTSRRSMMEATKYCLEQRFFIKAQKFHFLKEEEDEQ